MAGDQRDWYRDWWRKKTRYVERADFRVSFGELERSRRARAWRSQVLKVLALALLLAAAVLAKRLL